MNSSTKKRSLIINHLIDFFYHLRGNRSMPNLFPNVFNKDNLRDYSNKPKQLAYLFKTYEENDDIESLLDILIRNIPWNEKLEKELNRILEDLNLICQDGAITKFSEIKLTFGEFKTISEEIHKDPDNKTQIIKKYDISLQDFNKVEESFKLVTKNFSDVIKSLTPVLNSIEIIKPVLDLTQFMTPITDMMKNIEPSLQLGRIFTDLLPNIPDLPVYSTFTPSTTHLLEDLSLKGEVMIYELCPITRNNCSLHDVDIHDLEKKRPYAFLIYPSAHKDLERITKEILDEYGINIITAIAEPFIGGKYCKICSFIKYCNFCIAELGELNLNVFMEIGLAFGFDKFTILTLNENYTSQKEIPFDLDSFMNIPYKTNDELKINLKNHVEKIIHYIDLS